MGWLSNHSPRETMASSISDSYIVNLFEKDIRSTAALTLLSFIATLFAQVYRVAT